MKPHDYSLEELIEKFKKNNIKLDKQKFEKAISIIDKSPAEFINRKKEAHVINTAAILADAELDSDTIIAGLLHHILRNKEFNKEWLEKEFGKEIAELAEGMQKIDSIEERNKNSENPEILSKLILATAKDIRTLFIRLAARLESLRSIEYLPEQTQKAVAQSTLNIYVPICHKLGLHKMRWEMEDLAMKKLAPNHTKK